MTATCNADPAAYAAEVYCLFRKVLNTGEITAARVELDAMLGNLPVRQVVYKDGEHQEIDARPEYLTEPHPMAGIPRSQESAPAPVANTVGFSEKPVT